MRLCRFGFASTPPVWLASLRSATPLYPACGRLQNRQPLPNSDPVAIWSKPTDFIDMARKSIDQQIADAQAKLARLKNRARSARTHRLCQFGGAFDSIIDDALLADLRLVPDSDLDALRARVAAAIRHSAARTREAAASPGD